MGRNANKLMAAVASAALLAGAGALGDPTAAGAKNDRSADKRDRARAGLRPFGSCRGLQRYVRRHRGARKRSVVVDGVLPGGAEPVRKESGAPDSDPGSGAGADFSSTNVQEPGVDEPDLAKTDGRRIYALGGGSLHAIAADGPAPVELGSIPIGAPRSKGRYVGAGGDSELLLFGSRALVVSGLPSGDTLLSDVDVSDPAAMRVVSTMKVEGSYVSARLNEATARVVISSASVPRKPVPASVARIPAAAKPLKRKLVACGSVNHPTRFSGTDLLTVLTIDMARGLPAVDSDAITTSGDVVYGSASSLYVATESGGAAGSTSIHKFALAPGSTEYVGSGAVAGRMLSQWSMSERNGLLRVASTTDPLRSSRERNQSFVTVLADSGGRLAPIGRVGNLGRGQDIYAVRFVEDIAFVVTFRRIDPLYTIDLSAPSSPSVLGELEVRGFSSYLHPISPGLLLGIGQDATLEGASLGTQVSLFDVSNPAAPARLAQATVAGGSSAVESNHRAFLYWPPRQLAVMPLSVSEPRAVVPSFEGAVGFRVGTGFGVQEQGRIVHGAAPGEPIERTLVVGGRLYSLSNAGLLQSSLETLAPGTWIPFG